MQLSLYSHEAKQVTKGTIFHGQPLAPAVLPLGKTSISLVEKSPIYGANQVAADRHSK